MTRKLIILLIFMMLFMTCFAEGAYAQERRTYGRSGDICAEDYESIMKVLREHKATPGAPGEALLFDTGLRPKDAETAYRLINSFKALYQGKEDFVVIYNEDGYGYPTVSVHNTEGGASVMDRGGSGTGNGSIGIYAGWLLGSDPDESLRVHDEVWSKLTDAAKAAPADKKSRYRYYRDYLCNYLKPYSGAAATLSDIQESAGSSGYAGRYFALCSMNGDDCYYVPVRLDSMGDRIHYRNAIEDNGKYYWIDSYMSDLAGGSGYFMTPVSEEFAGIFEGPYILK